MNTNINGSVLKNRIGKVNLKSFTTSFGLLGLCLVLSIMSPVFLTTANLTNVLLQAAINATIAVGMTFVIITGGIDLSVGSILALSGVLLGGALRSGLNLFTSLIACLLIGALLGLINGFLITKGKLPPFIATLGMMSMARGLALVYTNGKSITGFSDGFRFIGRGSILGIYTPIVIMVVLYIIAYIILKYTRLGRYTYAIGGNSEGALLSGINVNKVLTILYVICGTTAAIGSIMLTARLNSAQPVAGLGYELDAIAAAVIGGTSLTGGEGSIVGTLIGALIISVLRNGLNLLNVSSYIQQVVIGLVIIIAVLADKNKK